MLIVGTGALACLFAARLSAAGQPVTITGTWAEGLQALRREGVRLVEADGSEQSYPVQVVKDPSDCASEPLALVLVKSWQTGRAARQLSRCLAQDGLALTLQNGLGNRETLASALGEERVASGITTTGANLLGPGRVQLAGEGSITLDERAYSSSLADLLRSAGFIVETTRDPEALAWGKLLINAAINPLTALLGVRNGELLRRSSARSLMAAIVCETKSVAAGLGIRLPYADPVRMVESVAQRTAANRSSMLQDISRGAPTEIDSICGAIVRAGEQAGVPTPLNHTLWQLVKALEAGQASEQDRKD